MRRAGNPIVAGYSALSLSIRCFPFFDRGIKGVRESHRMVLIFFQLGNQTCDGLLQVFALTHTLTIILDDERGGDTEKDYEQLTRQPAKMGAPILSVCGHAVAK